MFNNTQILAKLADELYPIPLHAIPRPRVQSEPCLPQRLPSTGVLQRDAEQLAPRAIIRGLRSPPNLDEEANNVAERPPTSAVRIRSNSTVTHPVQPTKSAKPQPPQRNKKPWKGSEPQPWEIKRAIERKDLMFLMEVRDQAFHLLLMNSGDATPLVHCMRIGKSHGDVAIVLLGAFSRWINHLEDDQMALPETKVLLRALRTNLKLAIDFGLQTSQSDLIASFMQTLIMSEGDRWVQDQAAAIGSALRAGPEGQPVKMAEETVRGFATRELGRAKHISALEDYVANATSDLLMLGAWHCALDGSAGEPIPTWYFARDDRVYRAFVAKLDQDGGAIVRSVGKRLKWQFRVLRTVMQGRARSYRQKVNLLAKELDGV